MRADVQVRVEVGGTPEQLAALWPTLTPAARRGLARGLTGAAGEVSIAGQARQLQRTGTLLESIRGELDAEGVAGAVGVLRESPAASYAYLLTGESRTIRPTRGQALTIPIGVNRTAAGVPRYASVEQLKRDFGAASVVRRGRAIGVQRGERFVAYFALARQVTVRGRDVLQPAVRDAAPEIASEVQREIDAALSEGGAA